METGAPTDRATLQKTLQHWREDTDLAAIRDPDSLAKRPADERDACTKLWDDVATLLRQAETPPAQESQP